MIAMNEPVGLLVWSTVLIVLWILALILFILVAFTISLTIYDVFKPVINNIADYFEYIFKKRSDKNE